MNNAITDVPGIKVGQYTDLEAATGCTVILCEQGAIGGVEVRGAAPGTRETDLLRPTNLVQTAHAIVLTGGSAFGLDAATGVMKYLEEKEIGFDTRVARVPIVPAAVLFDLAFGNPRVRPDAQSGYQACQAAMNGEVEEGNIGAGTGATVGKILGAPNAMKGGLGTASHALPGGIVVGAIVAVNAVGDVVDPETGRILAGARKPDGSFANAIEVLKNGGNLPGWREQPGTNTTIGVIATNAYLTKEQSNKVAQMAHSGLARAIRPSHTMSDGDTIFALSLGRSTDPPANTTLIGAVAAEVMATAIVRAVLAAKTLHGLPAAGDLGKD